jgi:D-aspartate ligase
MTSTRAPRRSRLREDVAAPAALVIGLDSITGLQTSRILARRGVRVVGIAADGRHPSARTNTCGTLVVSPTAGDPLLHSLDRLAGSEAGAVLFPCTDASVRTLAHAAPHLRAFRPVLPEPDTVDTLMDKGRFAELVEREGLPAPPTQVVTSEAQARRAADDLRFPCVVKPTLKTPRWEAAGATVRRFTTRTDWLDAAEGLLELHPELVIQEWLPGGDDQLYSCDFYVSPAGVPILTFVARNLRSWPPQVGTTSLGEAVLDDAIRDLAMRVISKLPFIGLGCVEVKRDLGTGVDHLIEATVGRPTERSAIAEAGGVELLYTMYRDAIGASLPARRRQRDRPVKWVHLRRDVPAAWREVQHRELTLPGWVRTLRGPKVYADLDLSDPVPFVADVTRSAERLLRRRPHGRSSRRRPRRARGRPHAPEARRVRVEPAGAVARGVGR